MSTLKKGDIVRFLNSVGGGKVTRLDDKIAYVEDEDGFEVPVLRKECVVVLDAEAAAAANPQPPRNMAAPAPTPSRMESVPAPKAPAAVKAVEEPEIEEEPEVEGNDVLNITLGYEPLDIKQISSTTFDLFLVNDSNYYLYLTYLTRPDGNEQWTARYAGLIEPNMQVFLCEVLREQLVEMDNIAVEFVAFKRGKPFERKPPVSVEVKLDTTKFCKLHCFTSNPYFDTDVFAVDIVKDGEPQRRRKMSANDARRLEESMLEKKRIDRRKPAPVMKRRKADPATGIIEVDLHIHELVDTTAGLSPADILNLQVDRFREVMDSHLKDHGRKIVFIHGKGEGVLRNAIIKELNYRYKGHTYQDASFHEYGFGATQVTIR